MTLVLVLPARCITTGQMKRMRTQLVWTAISVSTTQLVNTCLVIKCLLHLSQRQRDALGTWEEYVPFYFSNFLESQQAFHHKNYKQILEEPCGLTKQQVWVPPGNWVEKDTHQLYSGPKVISRSFTNYEVPVFIKAGAIIPEIPVKTGDTIGLASRQYSELVLAVWLFYYYCFMCTLSGMNTYETKQIYPGAMNGNYTIYEDDGHSYDYLQSKSSEIVTSYTRNGNTLKVTVSTSGSFVGQLPTRKISIKAISSMVPTNVKINGESLNFKRWGGDSSWSYDGSEGALIVEGEQQRITSTLTFEITSPVAPVGINGMKGKIFRGRLSKDNLDEVRHAPGANVVDPAGAPLSKVSAMGDALSYLAGHDVGTFTKMVAQFPSLFANATTEISKLAAKNKDDPRDDYSVEILQTAA